jgi:hypothetical protein
VNRAIFRHRLASADLKQCASIYFPWKWKAASPKGLRSAISGGAVITEFKVDVPGNYTLVDHSLARAERGLLGILQVEGPPNPDIYNGQVMPGMGH